MSPRVVLLTADGRRHRWLARRLAAFFPLAGIVSEPKPPAAAAGPVAAPDDRDVIDRHLAERETVEAERLGPAPAWPDTAFLSVLRKTADDAAARAWVSARRPDILVLYGCGLVRRPVLDITRGLAVNLHLGLSPYYRGAATNFWPLVHAEPECVGATVHFAVEEVDAGPILVQVRPEADPGDRAHDLGCKALVAGAEALLEGIRRAARGEAGRPPSADVPGRVFRRRDFTAEAVRRLWARLDEGMIPRYLERLAERRGRFPIVA